MPTYWASLRIYTMNDEINDVVMDKIDQLYDPLSDPKRTTWKNDDNTDSYTAMPIEEFKNYIATSGLENNEDIQAIYDDHIKNTASVLEIGAGFGRVISALIDRDYRGKIVAVEKNKKLYDHLYNNYSNVATIINDDILINRPSQKFDVLLWIWGGFCEIPKSQQLQALEKLIPLLNKKGKIIIDAYRIEDENSENKHFSMKTKHGMLYCYFASLPEFYRYAETINMEVDAVIDYTKTTVTKIVKSLIIFKLT